MQTLGSVYKTIRPHAEQLHASSVCEIVEHVVHDFFANNGKDTHFRVTWFKGGRAGISFAEGCDAELFARNKKEISEQVKRKIRTIPWFGFTIVPHSEE